MTTITIDYFRGEIKVNSDNFRFPKNQLADIENLLTCVIDKTTERTQIICMNRRTESRDLIEVGRW